MLQVKNRAYSFLASPMTEGDLVLTLVSGGGSAFPSGYPFRLTIEDEIIICTGRAAVDVLQITRAAEDTIATSHPAAAMVSLNITAGIIQGILAGNVSNIINVVNIRDYGAVGDGETDDTAAIRSAITASVGGLLYIPSGTYLVSEDAATKIIFQLVSNITIYMEEDAVIQVAPTDSAYYYTFYLIDVNNITIHGGILRGDKYTHIGAGGEFGHGIYMQGSCDNIKIENVSIEEMWGDGIGVVHGESGSHPTDILISGCTVHDNRRCGIGIIAALGMIITNCTISDTGDTVGTSPKTGIVLEAMSGSQIKDVIISNNMVMSNCYDGIILNPSDLPGVIENVVISGNMIAENGTNGIATSNREKNLKICGNVIRDNGAIASGYGVRLLSSGCVVSDNLLSGNIASGIRLLEAARNIISGNQIYENNTGLVITYSSHYNMVFGNHIYANDGPGIQLNEFGGGLNSFIGNYVFSNCMDSDNANIFLEAGENNLFSGNKVIKLDTHPGIGIYIRPDVSGTIVINNDLRDAGNTQIIANMGENGIIRNNLGYVTENNGAATITAAATSIAVTHGLSETPALDDISVTTTNNMGNSTKFWITNPTATQFTINVDVAPGENTATFVWTASIQ